MELFPHNQESYDKVLSFLQTTHKCALVQGTGTGKTFVLMKLLDTIFQGLDVLVAAPEVAVLEGYQLYDEWDYPNVRLVTFDGLSKIKESPMVLVIDEIHRAGAKTWNREILRLIKGVEYCFGMTATQYRYLDGRRDMAKELFGDSVVIGLSYDEAIQMGILAAYDYYAILSDTEEYITEISKYNLSTELKTRVRSLRLDEYQLSRRIRGHIDEDHKKWVIFYPNTDALEQADTDIWEWFGTQDVNIYRVYSSQTKMENKRNIRDFNSDNGLCVILSVNMLNEGVHLKGVTGVIFARKTESGNVFVQQRGRGSSTNKEVRIKYLDLVRNFHNVIAMCKSIDGARARVEGKVSRDKKNIVESTQVLVCYDEVLLELEDILAKAEGRWSEYEEDIVRVFYPIEGADCQLRIPHHTRQDVQRHARILGVTKTRKWTEGEDEVLKMFYKSEREGVWKRLPGRTMSAIDKRVEYLGLKETWSKYDDLLLLYSYGVANEKQLCELLPGKSLDDIKKRSKFLGL